MVFPLYDENPFKKPRLPWVTWTLIGINLVMFLIQVSSTDDIQLAMLASLAVSPASLIREFPMGVLPPELTLITSQFLHGGWEHLLGNMVYLWVFGDDIEEALGWWRFLLFCLLCGVLAALSFVVFNLHQTTPLIGASGAISGVLAAYLLIRPCAKISVFVLRIVVRLRAYWVIGGWVLLQLIMYGGSDSSTEVAYVAHIGGYLAGVGLLLLLRPADLRLFECIDPPEPTLESAPMPDTSHLPGAPHQR